MHSMMEYEEATRIYRKKMLECETLFRLSPPMPNPYLSHRDAEKETWYLRDDDGKLIARISRGSVRLP
jgi:hypothetical protein